MLRGVGDCEQLGKLDTLNKKIGFQVELNVEFILLSRGEGFLDTARGVWNNSTTHLESLERSITCEF